MRRAARAALLAVAVALAGCGDLPEPPTTPGATPVVADRLFVEENYEAALVSYRDFVARAPSGPPRTYALFHSGLCLARLRRHDEAVVALHETLSAEPAPSTRAAVYEALADVARDRGDLAAAVAHCEAVSRLLNTVPEAHGIVQEDRFLYNYGVALQRTNQWERGAELWTELASRFPKSPWTTRTREDLPGTPKTFSVQVGRFSRAQAIYQLIGRLEKKGFRNTLTEPVAGNTEGPGGTPLTAVRVGPFATWGEAERERARLKAAGFDGFVIP